MKRILKWTIPVDGQSHQIGLGPVLRAECQHGPDQVQIWTHEAVDDVSGWPVPGRTRPAMVVATGQPLDDDWFALATALTADGALVWHVVQVTH